MPNYRKQKNKKNRLSVLKMVHNLFFVNTIKPLYNDHARDPIIVAVVDKWSLFRGHLFNESSNWNYKMMVVIDSWSLFGGGR